MLSIYMGQPSTGTRSDAQSYKLRAIQDKYKDKFTFVYPERLVHRISHDFARNAYVDQFLQSKCDILWFLDSDVVPPENCLDLITEHGEKWDLAGCPYPVFITQKGWDGPQIVFTVYKRADGGMYPCSIPAEGQEFVDGIATGCQFIKRSVFDKLTKPFYEHKYDAVTRELIEGEDLGFCRKVSDLGYKYFVDYSMVCKHYKMVDLLDVNNYAIQYSNNNILNYDRTLRTQLFKKKLQMAERPKLYLP